VRRDQRKDCTGISFVFLSYVVSPLDHNARGDPIVPKGYKDPFRGCFNRRPLSTTPAGLNPKQIEADIKAMRQGADKEVAV